MLIASSSAPSPARRSSTLSAPASQPMLVAPGSADSFTLATPASTLNLMPRTLGLALAGAALELGISFITGGSVSLLSLAGFAAVGGAIGAASALWAKSAAQQSEPVGDMSAQTAQAYVKMNQLGAPRGLIVSRDYYDDGLESMRRGMKELIASPRVAAGDRSLLSLALSEQHLEGVENAEKFDTYSFYRLCLHVVGKSTQNHPASLDPQKYQEATREVEASDLARTWLIQTGLQVSDGRSPSSAAGAQVLNPILVAPKA